MAKEKIRNIGALLLSVAYCLVVFFSTSGSFAYPKNHYTSNNQSKSQAYFSNITTNLYSSTAGAERITKDSNHGAVVDLKNFAGISCGIIHADSVLFKSRFSQYVRNAISFLVRYRKADIIFPFHYFW